MYIISLTEELRNLERKVDGMIERLKSKGHKNIVAYAYRRPDGLKGCGVMSIDNQTNLFDHLNNVKNQPCRPARPWSKTKLKRFYKMIEDMKRKGLDVIAKEVHDETEISLS
jgi:hypothetical protein